MKRLIFVLLAALVAAKGKREAEPSYGGHGGGYGTGHGHGHGHGYGHGEVHAFQAGHGNGASFGYKAAVEHPGHGLSYQRNHGYVAPHYGYGYH